LLNRDRIIERLYRRPLLIFEFKYTLNQVNISKRLTKSTDTYKVMKNKPTPNPLNVHNSHQIE